MWVDVFVLVFFWCVFWTFLTARVNCVFGFCYVYLSEAKLTLQLHSGGWFLNVQCALHIFNGFLIWLCRIRLYLQWGKKMLLCFHFYVFEIKIGLVLPFAGQSVCMFCHATFVVQQCSSLLIRGFSMFPACASCLMASSGLVMSCLPSFCHAHSLSFTSASS